MSGKRITREFETTISAPVDKVFPLLCPVREYDWIPQWQCEIIYTDSGVAELGCVFSTRLNDGLDKEIWVVSHYEPGQQISFVRTGPNTTIRFQVTLTPAGNKTTIRWYQEITSLNSSGDQVLAESTKQDYHARMTALNKMLDHYLQNGVALNLDTA